MNLLLRAACGIMLGVTLAGAQETDMRRHAREIEESVPDKNPYDSDADAALGRRYFLGHCAVCHGKDGAGGRGANLTTGRYRMGGSDRELYRTIRNGIEGSEMPGTRLHQDEVWRIVAYVKKLGAAGAEEKAAGDAAHGKIVYETKGGCAACHAIDGRGGTLGPDLSEIGLRRSLKFLRESLVDPGAAVEREYRTVTVVLPDGAKITGIRLNEDDYSVQLRDTAGNLRSFLTSEVEVEQEGEVEVEGPRKVTRSLMPAYGTALTAGEMDDLVAYLNTLRGNRQGNQRGQQ
ncbi:MAG TPA: c-type cytochrome [Bryobacterales bacterium]|nr:c-type cytochrome [Bryobacterales bacterium]